jgi:CPA2 family monovalent cation:H+ antiporter-2
MDIGILNNILVILVVALAITVLFRFFKLPVILGYIFAGALIGPHALAWIEDIDSIKHFAEFGIVFLMFTIGLEFSLSKLFAMKYRVFLLGGLQVFFSIAITTLIGQLLGIPWLVSLVIGGIVAMSSTAIVSKQLIDQLELNQTHGMNAISILLFQDLAVIPIIIFIASIAHASGELLLQTLLWAVFKGIIAIIVILFIGRWLLRPLFRLIAGTRTIELFTLAVLMVATSAAVLSYQLGLSFALGAFLAGIMLGETEYRHQIEVEIRPFRDILLALFFLSIGMLLNVATWPETWMWILLLLIALMLGKALLIIFLSWINGYHLANSFRTGIILAQGGEFGFAILTLALSNQILPADYGQVILSALVISIFFAPLLIYFNKPLTKLLFSESLLKTQTTTNAQLASLEQDLVEHVIICGYGRVGQNIGRFLEKVECPYLAIDLDPKLVENARLAGEPVIYGDATHTGILNSSGIAQAKALVISFENTRAAIKILNQVRSQDANIPILVRCRDEVELTKLLHQGASEIVTEIFEESLTLALTLLKAIHIPNRKISQLIRQVRENNYDILRKVFPSELSDDIQQVDFQQHYMRPVLLQKNAYAANKRLGELNLAELDIQVTALCHQNHHKADPHPNTKLHAGDILIIYGNTPALENAEKKLLKG